MPAYPKPETRATTKRRDARTEAQVKAAVRAVCVERDGWCRIERDVKCLPHQESAALWLVAGACAGPSEWAHLPPWTRARTRNMPLEQRHSRQGSAMLCRTHHDHVDGRRQPRLVIQFASPLGADGPMTFTAGANDG